MTVLYESPYSHPGAAEPLTHARILHANNWLTGGTVVASTTDSDYFADGPNNSLTYEKWKPTTLAATWEYDHGSSVEIDTLCIGAHTMGTNANTLRVQYYDGAAWTGLIATTAITSDEDIMVILEPRTAQRWRVYIFNGTVPEIGVIKWGNALQMPRPLYGGHTPVKFARQTTLRSNRSETGEFLGRSKQRTMLKTQYDWTNITATWMRANWNDLQTAVEEEPFFIAWRPDAIEDVALAQTDGPPQPSNMGVRDLMQVSLAVQARGYD